MNEEQERQVRLAAKELRLRDVQLFGARFERPTPAFAAEDIRARQEYMRNVRYVTGDAELEGKTFKVLQILVTLGTRVLADTEGENPDVYFQIEADFLVEFEMIGDLDEQAIIAFANFNAVHNAWPFWRQHVYDVMQRGRLPHLDIPLYPGTRS